MSGDWFRTTTSPNPLAYLTLWRQDASGSWTRLALLPENATRFRDTTALPGASYAYRAHLVNGTAVSDWSNLASVTTLSDAPAHLMATVGAGPKIRLTWSNPRPDPQAYVTVWRAGSTGSWTRVALLRGDATAFTDTTAAAGGSYRYRAHRVKGAEVSGWSDEATVVIPGTPGP